MLESRTTSKGRFTNSDNTWRNRNRFQVNIVLKSILPNCNYRHSFNLSRYCYFCFSASVAGYYYISIFSDSILPPFLCITLSANTFGKDMVISRLFLCQETTAVGTVKQNGFTSFDIRDLAAITVKMIACCTADCACHRAIPVVATAAIEHMLQIRKITHASSYILDTGGNIYSQQSVFVRVNWIRSESFNRIPLNIGRYN